MANLDNALHQHRAERKEAELRVEKLYQAISMTESLDGSGASRKATRPTRIVSAAARRRMAKAQRARWARVRQESRSAAGRSTSTARAKRTISAAGRRRIAAAQRARWAKIRAQEKKAA
jgi:phage major head subunit gpT-like protein